MKLWIILIFLASYIIGVLGWSILVLKEQPYLKTIGDLVKEMCETPAFVPVGNIMILIGYIIYFIWVFITRFIYKHCGIEKVWNKIKDKKLPHRKK